MKIVHNKITTTVVTSNVTWPCVRSWRLSWLQIYTVVLGQNTACILCYLAFIVFFESKKSEPKNGMLSSQSLEFYFLFHFHVFTCPFTALLSRCREAGDPWIFTTCRKSFTLQFAYCVCTVSQYFIFYLFIFRLGFGLGLLKAVVGKFGKTAEKTL